jgi:orotate phosphoribosyltransferase
VAKLEEFLAKLAQQPEWAGTGPITTATRASTGDTALHAAIWAADDEVARALIAAGADVNAAGEDGYTPLHAAIAQTNVPLARRLTERGASWEAVNAFSCSVREAARRSDDAGVRALFEQEQLVSTLPGRIGHFSLESGHHSDLWLDLETLCARPEFVRARAGELAKRLDAVAPDIEIVCGPLVEGAYVALLVALELGVEFCYAERIVPDGKDATNSERLYAVRYELPPVLRSRVKGQRVAIVNDVISAGSAVRGTLAHLDACGANTVAIGALAVLGPSMTAFAEGRKIPFEHLARFPHNLWTPDECPLCKANVPLS